ncbi:hypothetical protein ACGFIE_30470 [Micromonospora sp. NPDC049275]|uniref:hypothetical protein n=1 Tax=Micromonospora sp. NPDC049275 TaxID=3364268 RepID=UPI00371DAF4D
MTQPTSQDGWNWEQAMVNLLGTEGIIDRNQFMGAGAPWLVADWVGWEDSNSSPWNYDAQPTEGGKWTFSVYRKVSYGWGNGQTRDYFWFLRGKVAWYTGPDANYQKGFVGATSSRLAAPANTLPLNPESLNNAAESYYNAAMWLEHTVDVVQQQINKVDDDGSGFKGSASHAFSRTLNDLRDELKLLRLDLDTNQQWFAMLHDNARAATTFLEEIRSAWAEFLAKPNPPTLISRALARLESAADSLDATLGWNETSPLPQTWPVDIDFGAGGGTYDIMSPNFIPLLNLNMQTHYLTTLQQLDQRLRSALTALQTNFSDVTNNLHDVRTYQPRPNSIGDPNSKIPEFGNMPPVGGGNGVPNISDGGGGGGGGIPSVSGGGGGGGIPSLTGGGGGGGIPSVSGGGGGGGIPSVSGGGGGGGIPSLTGGGGGGGIPSLSDVGGGGGGIPSVSGGGGGGGIPSLTGGGGGGGIPSLSDVGGGGGGIPSLTDGGGSGGIPSLTPGGGALPELGGGGPSLVSGGGGGNLPSLDGGGAGGLPGVGGGVGPGTGLIASGGGAGLGPGLSAGGGAGLGPGLSAGGGSGAGAGGRPSGQGGRDDGGYFPGELGGLDGGPVSNIGGVEPGGAGLGGVQTGGAAGIDPADLGGALGGQTGGSTGGATGGALGGSNGAGGSGSVDLGGGMTPIPGQVGGVDLGPLGSAPGLNGSAGSGLTASGGSGSSFPGGGASGGGGLSSGGALGSAAGGAAAAARFDPLQGQVGTGSVAPAGYGSTGSAPAGAGGMPPFMPPMGGQAGGKDRERTTWLAEDEEVWGTDPDLVPAVIGRLDAGDWDADESSWEPTPQAPATPGQSRDRAVRRG